MEPNPLREFLQSVLDRDGQKELQRLQQCFLVEFCRVYPQQGKILQEQLRKAEVQEKAKRVGRRS